MNKKSGSYQERDTLKGKVTLVTGATGGIGKEICKRFAELGSFVYICDIKESAKLAGYVNEKNQILSDRFAEQDYGVASAKENTGLADVVEKKVTSMLSDGSMKELQDQWGLQ